MLDLQKIQQAFADNRTPEQKEFDAQVEAEWAAYDAEIAPIAAEVGPEKWAKMEAVAQRYRERGLIRPLISLNE